MIWHSTNYFNQDFVTKVGITKDESGEKTTYKPYAIILGIVHTLGESDTEEDAKAWLDKWVSDGKWEEKKEKGEK
jgi:hypothetical protein